MVQVPLLRYVLLDNCIGKFQLLSVKKGSDFNPNYKNVPFTGWVPAFAWICDNLTNSKIVVNKQSVRFQADLDRLLRFGL